MVLLAEWLKILAECFHRSLIYILCMCALASESDHHLQYYLRYNQPGAYRSWSDSTMIHVTRSAHSMGECEYNVVSFRRSECWHMHNHTMCVRQEQRNTACFLSCVLHNWWSETPRVFQRKNITLVKLKHRQLLFNFNFLLHQLREIIKQQELQRKNIRSNKLETINWARAKEFPLQFK